VLLQTALLFAKCEIPQQRKSKPSSTGTSQEDGFKIIIFFFFKDNLKHYFLLGVCHFINILKNVILNAGAFVATIYNTD